MCEKWSGDEIYRTPVFGQVMPRDRFLLLLRFLHCNDNDATDVNNSDRDRLHKIRPIISMLRHNCTSVCIPGPDLCVDESLVLYKGRLAFKQIWYKTVRTLDKLWHFVRLRFTFGTTCEICQNGGLVTDSWNIKRKGVQVFILYLRHEH